MIPADLADADQCVQVVARALDALGGLDILVNNAGQQFAVGSLEELSDEQVEQTFAVNILAMFRLTKAAINAFTKGLSVQLAPRGIRVNAVAPGPVWTPLQPSHGQPPGRRRGAGAPRLGP